MPDYDGTYERMDTIATAASDPTSAIVAATRRRRLPQVLLHLELAHIGALQKVLPLQVAVLAAIVRLQLLVDALDPLEAGPVDFRLLQRADLLRLVDLRQNRRQTAAAVAGSTRRTRRQLLRWRFRRRRRRVCAAAAAAGH